MTENRAIENRLNALQESNKQLRKNIEAMKQDNARLRSIIEGLECDIIGLCCKQAEGGGEAEPCGDSGLGYLDWCDVCKLKHKIYLRREAKAE